MRQAENQQPEHAPVVQRGDRSTGGLGAFGEQHDARAEQRRKQRHHLLVG